jgi:hypothetical protein
MHATCRKLFLTFFYKKKEIKDLNGYLRIYKKIAQIEKKDRGTINFSCLKGIKLLEVFPPFVLLRLKNDINPTLFQANHRYLFSN